MRWPVEPPVVAATYRIFGFVCPAPLVASTVVFGSLMAAVPVVADSAVPVSSVDVS
jgi:hypothetical protein